MALYDSLFGMMDIQAAQLLVTVSDFQDPNFRGNLSATVEDLLAMNVVPVFNENDAISGRPQSQNVRWSTFFVDRVAEQHLVGCCGGRGTLLAGQ
jgi:hypothetical protein